MAQALILIIEDDELSRKLLRDVFRAEGYATVETETGEEGLEIARSRRPSLVLMDIGLPGMNGLAALCELRADPRTAGVPVIAVSASAMPLERAEILAAGFDGFFAKPLDVDRVIEQVRTVLEAGGQPR